MTASLVTTPVLAVERITPTVAEGFLARNEVNRSLRWPIVHAYARDMAAGRWQLTGDSIKFDRSGVLLDGQHRLHAVVEAELEIEMFVARNLDTSVRDVVDTNISRSAADVLTFAGQKNANTLAASARVGLLFENGYLLNSGAQAMGGGQYRATHGEINEFVATHGGLIPAVDDHSKTARQLFLPQSIFCYAAYRMLEANPTRANEFLEGLSGYATTGRGDPRLALLVWAQRAHEEHHRIGLGEGMWSLLTTWREFLAGGELIRLHPYGAGHKPRPMPEVSA